MKRFRLIMAAMVAAVLVLAVPRSAVGERVEVTQVLTTGTVTLASGGFVAVDLSQGLGGSAASVYASKSATVRVRVYDDASSVTAMRVVARLFASKPSTSDLDSASPGESGVPVLEGEYLDFPLSARWLGIRENASTANTRVVVYRVE